MSWRDWSGYFAASVYEVHHDREHNAIRNAAALIDVSPLFKYRLSGKDATRLADRILTRGVPKMKVGQVAYTHWCDGEGKVIDDGTISRLGEDVFRWTAAEPTLRWIRENAHGLEAKVEDVSDHTAAVALQGPTSRDVLRACAEGDVAGLNYFRVMPSRIAGPPLSRSSGRPAADLTDSRGPRRALSDGTLEHEDRRRRALLKDISCFERAGLSRGESVESCTQTYRARRPETMALYAVVRDNLETLYGAIDDGALAVRIPKHARKELESYLDCGLLCRAFARLLCQDCGRGGWWRSVARAGALARRAPDGG